MTKQLIARGTDGLVSIHVLGANIDAPLDDINSFFFHSSFNYLGVIQIVDMTLSIPARTNAFVDNMFVLAAHGLGYAPMVMGHRTDNAQTITGDAIVWTGPPYWTWISLALGADDSFVYARATSQASPENYEARSTPAMSIPIRAYIMGNPAA